MMKTVTAVTALALAAISMGACSREAQQNAQADASATAAELNATAAKAVDDVNAATAASLNAVGTAADRAGDKIDAAADAAGDTAANLANQL